MLPGRDRRLRLRRHRAQRARRGHRPPGAPAARVPDRRRLVRALEGHRHRRAAPEKNAGYGFVCDLDGRRLPGLRVARTWQEHGLVVSAEPLAPDAFPIGSRVRILPNHACPTAAAHDRYFVVNGTRDLVAEWPRVNGW
ncbi:hypothetical protein [Oleiharenicola sp. Vm1]|uniref:hypothetical protein n=1 Tax=Oleiharenicola sp. Vm1 TaxID=3398393 RepID=UPI0039F4D103